MEWVESGRMLERSCVPGREEIRSFISQMAGPWCNLVKGWRGIVDEETLCN